MKIKKLTITEKELNLAVESWLATQGVILPVERVFKEYSYESCFTVDFVEKDEPKPTPTPEAE